MLTSGEDRIVRIVAVDWNGKILSPCGRCRELVLQVSGDGETEVIIGEDRVVKIKELMPNHWYENSSRAFEDQIN